MAEDRPNRMLVEQMQQGAVTLTSFEQAADRNHALSSGSDFHFVYHADVDILAKLFDELEFKRSIAVHIADAIDLAI